MDKITDDIPGEESLQQDEVLKHFRPDIHEVMADFFKDWEFVLHGEKMEPDAVFSDVGFMPLIMHATRAFYQKNFEEKLPRGLFEVSEDDAEGSIFGMRSIIDMDLSKPHQSVLLMLVMTHCCCDIFGKIPCRIDLDELVEWAGNETLQQDGLPDLVRATQETM